MTNGEYLEKIVQQDEDYCILKDAVAGTVTIEVSFDLWNKSLADPCDDCISRQAVLALPRNKIRDFKTRGGVVCETINVTDIENLPSVTPKQRTGHWEYVQYDYNPKLGNWHCSECRCIVVECVNKEEDGGIPLYKYCPQCGAKIVEPRGSEEA